jgi:hypothetical protein
VAPEQSKPAELDRLTGRVRDADCDAAHPAGEIPNTRTRWSWPTSGSITPALPTERVVTLATLVDL